MLDLNSFLNPTEGLSVVQILGISFVLGVLHGITPDEHTWPITFSYSIGSYSSRGGMKAGFIFSLGFTSQRAILTTLGFTGMAVFFKIYNLNWLIYIMVGFAMFVAGSYFLKGKFLHLPIDVFLKGTHHHSTNAERIPLHEAEIKPIPVKMALIHGFIAGWGIGAYATIITFILAPQLPSIFYAPLAGIFFGIGTMCMQVILGTIFASIMRIKKITETQLRYLGKFVASRTLYVGGLAFIIVGALIVIAPNIDKIGISTGNLIPNLDSIGVEFVLVVGTVGIIGIISMIRGYREIRHMDNLK
jgi:predicted membrane protein